ncbi:UDP-N-acetylmuramoylalanine--D-glutamate ligase [Candidatus Epulonipiscium fishelsonii]|uniref:UDP-N-acetylmuramoylalanine--D-glutamate ligase n=1 Tax=Candidatus Epulonipiscium fishelsonii TaxID=77094 RepID=A0ACC8XFE0_9FIRM|nr:UDP-N-acetylmuramoylalanine--D-glutamate ligase [Epulopiscium sp. SCG-B11WGA-EpuloA1]
MFLIIGCARSGLAAAKLALTQNEKVGLYDSKTYDKLNQSSQQQVSELENQGVCLFLGEIFRSTEVTQLIVSPGVPLEIDIITYYKEKNVPIMGEFEYASTFCKAPIIGITGTNGKTTTTSLVGEIFRAFNPKTYVVGNIGQAFSEKVLEIPEDGIVIAELSSFQLETTTKLKCSISTILNISPDHLNRHHTMENYINAKFKIINMNAPIILNQEDGYLKDLITSLSADIKTFSSKQPVACGTYFKDGQLCQNMLQTQSVVCNEDELHILGEHNIENALAAISIAIAYGVPMDIIKKELINFKGVEHRIEFVRNINGIKFYNDSKATNTGAAIPGLLAMKGPTRLIAGGMDKHSEFDEWIQLFEGRVKKVYLIGETTNQIIDTCKKYGFDNVESYDTLDKATLVAYEEGEFGDNILLSPACASWDMFESYEQRGNLFKYIINNLEG